MKKLFAIAASTLLIAGCGVELGFPDGSADGGSSGQKGDGLMIFVTDDAFKGNGINGISSADALCNNDRNKPTTGTYLALLYSSGTSSATRTLTNGWPIKTNTTYIRPDGTIIGKTDSTRQFISYSASVSTTSTNVWTGVVTSFGSGQNCQDWTVDGTGGAQGQFGQATGSGPGAFAAGVTNCNTPYPIYCVQQ